jgi:formate dehydrogenase major subunit
VAGLANVWGYGAMTNNMNDIRNSKSVIIVGQNPAENHPISMQHILTAKERNKAPLIVVDPRFTKTAAHATQYVRIRQGADVAFIYGLINVILKNGWEDKQMIEDRTYGFAEFKSEIDKWDLATASDVSGVSVREIERVAKSLADNRPGCVIWAMGGTQHTHGTNVTRSFCALQLVLGNMGKPGGGANVFRGHDNVQGATDLGNLSNTLPGYYGLSQGAFKHWSKVWGLDFEWLKGRFRSKKMMGSKGFTVARWHEGVLMDAKKELSNGGENVHAALFWGHATNCQSQMHRVKKALEKIELIVEIDPYVTSTSIVPDRKDGVYLLPAATQYEQMASVTNSNRDIMWRNRIVSPVWESRTDLAILLDLAQRLGLKDKLATYVKGPWKGVPKDMKNVKELSEETIASVVDEWNTGMRTIGMVGQTHARMKRQMDFAHVFNIDTKRAEGSAVNGEYWGMPWPCWSDKHPGTPILYRDDVPVMDGGMGFRARWGTKAPDGRTLLAGNGAAPPKGSINAGYAQRKAWKTDITGKVFDEALAQGLAPYGNGRARFNAWNVKPDGVPIHREPLHSPRPDLIAKYPTYDDVKNHYRVPTLWKSLQKTDWVKDFPIMLNTGRVVEFEGGGAAGRASWWLVELQPEMYAEIHPKLANDYGIKNGEYMWVESPPDWGGSYGGRIKVRAKVTRRVGPDSIFLPYHWGGSWEGKSLLSKYPKGTEPYSVGDSANVVTNYGYDRITQMQETKAGLCRIRKATEV